MNESKACIMCCSQIDINAKKCPKCHSIQTTYSNLETNRLFLGGVVLFVFAVLGYSAYEIFLVTKYENEAINNLKITVNEVVTNEEEDTLYASCLGTIENNTKYTYRNLKYEVNFLSDDGVTLDTFLVEDKDIHTSPNNLNNFRVRGVAIKAKELYTNCEVKIVDGWSI